MKLDLSVQIAAGVYAPNRVETFPEKNLVVAKINFSKPRSTEAFFNANLRTDLTRIDGFVGVKVTVELWSYRWEKLIGTAPLSRVNRYLVRHTPSIGDGKGEERRAYLVSQECFKRT